MPKASDIKKSAAIEHEGKVYFVKEINKLTPSGRAGNSLYRMRMYDVATNAKADVSFKADDIITLADFSRHAASFSYIDGEEYIFMDNEDYTPYHFHKDVIEEELLFITEDIQGLHVLVVNGAPVALELPSTVDLEIVETDPSIKGASASARTKPAVLSTGLSVQVPEYIATGDRIRVNTLEHKYMNRVEK
ncbi:MULTISPECIES: elongation factor P-like protein YeiP [Photobacterium]|uniref:Elongation factor P-like protein n=1 Tax=Photobacterium halotolerans TaxID=265726 RepID=A0A0F5VGH3_9GAMM|nr:MULTISPECIES: elongation factor P-like protein YeiP [Photobacterium]KKD00927.1 elongation factor P [Photobacterium halotolerans]NAW67457.1 elongation factor P-like protein YeiP [Photobacterium halotolerans]NAW85415.1 elongation factor P-like protein YeiP [Photobacterium halotolerans]NAX48484.1 elongation factor P-like protein YeiP [Photobacterium halotolerans]